MKFAHTTFAKGKRVIVSLRDGSEWVDWFVEARSKFIVLRKAGRVMRSDLKSVLIPR